MLALTFAPEVQSVGLTLIILDSDFHQIYIALENVIKQTIQVLRKKDSS